MGAEEEELLKDEGAGPGAGPGAGRGAEGAGKDTMETTPLINRRHEMVGEDNSPYSPRCASRV